MDKATLRDSDTLAAHSTESTDIAARKYRALEDFIDRLLCHQVGYRVLKLILFGSLLRGEANEESDIDLLVISAGDLREMGEVCVDLSFDVLMDCGELVQPLIYCIDQYRCPNYFLRHVKSYGKELYSMDNELARRREVEDVLELAKNYLRMAKSLSGPDNVRGAIDLAYNAAELCARGLLMLRLDSIPKTHSGILRELGDVFIKSEGLLSPDVGRMLNKFLHRRSEARYDQHVVIPEDDARQIILLAEKMIQTLETELSELDV
jgi:uncharacterized protein (UPF0332 family)